MSDKKGLPPNVAFGAAPGVGYVPMTAAAPGAPPPSYVESLNHPVVGGPSAAASHQYAQQLSNAGALQAASAHQVQMSMAAAQQAQKVGYHQHFAQQIPAQMYMQQQAYAQQLAGYYPAHGHAAHIQPGQNVLVMNGYDTGARFDGLGQPTIPPPPPGVAPNAAQLAAAAGAQVSVTQKKGSYLSGGSGGGYTFW